MKLKAIKPIKNIHVFNGKTYVRYSGYIDKMEDIISVLEEAMKLKS